MSIAAQLQNPALIGVVGPSGAGKTTLIGKLIPPLLAAGVRVGVIKHTHHDVEPDRPGKDSWKARQAGAAQVLLAGPHRCTLFMDSPGAGQDPGLADLLKLMNTQQLDLILVEGMKYAQMAKIEVRRRGIDADWLYPQDAQIFAVVSDEALPQGRQPTVFGSDQAEALVALIQRIMPRT